MIDFISDLGSIDGLLFLKAVTLRLNILQVEKWIIEVRWYVPVTDSINNPCNAPLFEFIINLQMLHNIRLIHGLNLHLYPGTSFAA